jgi:hypothetical protein
MKNYKLIRRVKMTYNEQKLEEAIAYLRSRGKYVVDKTCAFRPTDSSATNVAQTVANYRREVMKTPLKAVRR